MKSRIAQFLSIVLLALSHGGLAQAAAGDSGQMVGEFRCSFEVETREVNTGRLIKSPGAMFMDINLSELVDGCRPDKTLCVKIVDNNVVSLSYQVRDGSLETFSRRKGASCVRLR